MKYLLALYLIEILHQTTTFLYLVTWPKCCILLKFYIKPQLLKVLHLLSRVVSY